MVKCGLKLKKASVRDTAVNHHLSFFVDANMFFTTKTVSYMSKITSIPKRILNIEKENMVY